MKTGCEDMITCEDRTLSQETTRGVSRFVRLSQQLRATCGTSRLVWLSHQSCTVPEVVSNDARQNSVQLEEVQTGRCEGEQARATHPASSADIKVQPATLASLCCVCKQRRVRPDVVYTTMRQTPIDFFLFRKH